MLSYIACMWRLSSSMMTHLICRPLQTAHHEDAAALASILASRGESSPAVNPPRCIPGGVQSQASRPRLLFILHGSVLALGSMIELVSHCEWRRSSHSSACLLRHQKAQTEQQPSTQVREHDARAAGVRWQLSTVRRINIGSD